jgi:hypothetical protein
MRLKRSALCLVLIALVVLTVSSTYACTIDEVKQDPEIPNEGEPVNVTATVTSEENKEHTAILSYSTDEGETWTNAFVGQIPPLPAGIKIRYKIIASDDEGYVAIYDNDDSLNISTYLPWILGAIAAAITVLIGVAYYRKKKK